MSEWKKYRRLGLAELRPYVPGESLEDISIPLDGRAFPVEGDMIARNPKNWNDKWLMPKEYFEENFELIEED